MSNNTEFKWDDASVLEFVQFTLKNSPLLQGRYTDLEQFKESKQLKPEWEVIKYRFNPIGNIIDNTSKYFINAATDCNYEIFSVKRLSDGEVFTIGDKFIANAGCDLTIKKFEIFGSDMKVFSMEYGYWLINNIKHKPIFTTEDGTAIYKDYSGKISTVYEDFSFNYDCPMRQILSEREENYPFTIKYFSTKEAAREFIIENKPLLSLKEIREVGHAEKNNPYYKKLVALAESKLK